MVNFKNINDMTEDELLCDEFLKFVYSGKDEVITARAEMAIKERAKKLGCISLASALIKAYKIKAKRKDKKKKEFDYDILLQLDENGLVKCNITNFERILMRDEHFASVRYNQLTEAAELEKDGKIRQWNDFDDSDAFAYIYEKYGIYSPQIALHAMNNFFISRAYHPIRELIESIKWDGKSRITSFLTEILHCDDTPYVREVSRLIFAGGIHRIYYPGCKFDTVPVLIGSQGAGKSTITRWLAMEDKYFGEVFNIEGKEGIESLNGKWICELGELIAVTKSKEVEAVKAYLSRQYDYYRPAYARRTVNVPRQCFFIGTTNKEQFLTDKTGNRRFLPVKVKVQGRELFGAENQIKEYIAQCWAEAFLTYLNGELSAVADVKLLDEIKKQQEEATEIDYRVDLIKAYVQDKERVCVLSIWENALHEKYVKPTRKDSTEISLIMQQIPEFEKSSGTIFIENYGSQRGWKRVEK